MSYRPQFKHCFRCEIVPSEGVFLLSEKGHFLLRGSAYMHLAPLLNGQHTLPEITEQLREQVSGPEVYYALELLKRKGYVRDATASMPPEQAAFWDMLEIDPEFAARRLSESPVSVVSLGGLDPAPFRSMLAAIGVPVDDGGRLIVLTDDYLHPELEGFNEQALARQRPWMLVKPVGTELWIGPLLMPGKTGCWACLAHRLQGHRKVENYLQEKNMSSAPFPIARSVLPSTLQTAFGLAITEVAQWLVLDTNEHLEGCIVTFNTLSLDKNDHVLVQRPQCPCCGDPAVLRGNQEAPPVLQSRKKVITTDGGYRSILPEETFEKYEHHISPITGIIKSFQRNKLPEKKLIFSYVVDHNFAHMNEDLYFLRASLRSRSGGKGKSKAQAKASALCESIERFSGVFQGGEPRIQARLEDLGAAGIPPNACMLFSEQQFARRGQANADRPWYYWVPEPFDETMEIEWSPVWSLTHDEPRYVPTAYCYYGYSRRHNIQFTRADSNGCAAGNGKEEAILQAFMELIERDSVAMWWYNRLKKPVVDLASFSGPYFQELLAFYQTIHRDLWVLDITSDFDVPAFAAISRRNDSAREDIILGFGAHFDAQLALLRALTELNQALPEVLSRKTDRAPAHDDPFSYPEATRWRTTATMENQPYLVPDKTARPKTQSDYPGQVHEDLFDDVMACVQIAQEKGLEMLVLDQTRPDIGLDVVKVIVPGLRHFWARFGPGRLYEVPVQMGWLKEPLDEALLNPTPILF